MERAEIGSLLSMTESQEGLEINLPSPPLNSAWKHQEIQRGHGSSAESPPTKALSPGAPGEGVLVDTFPWQVVLGSTKRLSPPFPS